MTFSALLEEFKRRNVRKTLAIYLSSALTGIGIIKLFQEVFGIPTFLFPVIVSLLTFGLGNVLVFAWYHGEQGEQRVGFREVLLHVAFLSCGVFLAFRTAEAPAKIAVPAGTKSIAVLPFKNMSESKEDEYFSDGMTEDILTQLSKIGDLRVISRTTMMKYKDTEKNIREIGNDLDVNTVLEGSVRREGSRVRIVSQLINAETDEHLWAETYDREMTNVFEIQSDVARQIAAALKAKLSPEEITRIEHKPTSNMDAYGFYLRGRDHYYRYQAEDNQKAIDFFKRALALDSTYALALAGLGDAYCQNAQKFMFPVEWYDSAIAESRKAIALNPSLAEGHKALAFAYEGKGKVQEALSEYRTAVGLNPNYSAAIANLGSLTQGLGNLDEAHKLLTKAVSLAPDRMFAYVSVALVYQTLTMDSLAFAWYDKAHDIDPDQLIALTQRGWLHLMRKEYDEAKRLRDTILARSPDWPLGLDFAGGLETYLGNYSKAQRYYDTLVVWGMQEAKYQLVYVLLKQGQTARGSALLRETLDWYMKEMGQQPSSYTALEAAILQSLAGNIPEANRLVNVAIEKGLRDYRWLLVDPRMEKLHGDPTFQSTMELLKRDVERMRQKVIEAETAM